MLKINSVFAVAFVKAFVFQIIELYLDKIRQ